MYLTEPETEALRWALREFTEAQYIECPPESRESRVSKMLRIKQLIGVCDTFELQAEAKDLGFLNLLLLDTLPYLPSQTELDNTLSKPDNGSCQPAPH